MRKPAPRIIAEVGANHMGDFEIAKEMVCVAHRCGVYGVKFQKRNPRECLSPERYDRLYDGENSFGRTYGEHREKLEFTLEQHAELSSLASRLGIVYSSSVWDETSFLAIKELHPPWIKIPSAHNEDWPLLRKVRDEWKNPVHVSLGMSEPDLWKDHEECFGDRLVSYVCTSTYPSSFSDVLLCEIQRIYRESMFTDVGFSGHHLGIAIDIAAAVLGATYIERHFTLNRTWKGTDQAASLEPDGLKKLVRDISAVSEAWNMRTGILTSEIPIYEKLKVKREL